MADEANESLDEAVVETEEIINNDSPEAADALEQATDVTGDLVVNPGLEEVADEDEDETDEADEATDDKLVPTTTETTPKTTEVAEPVEVTATPDPGAFQPKGDYSFEVVTLDGKTVKITSPAEADTFAERLDGEEGLISVSQLTKFSRGVARMDSGLEREQRDWLHQKTQFEEQAAANEAREMQISNWTKELKYLEVKGLIPKIDSAKDSDWLGNAADAAVKARMDVFKWMDAENKDREAAGIAPVTSAVDAFQMMRAEQAEQTATAEKTTEADRRRAKGAIVGGNAPHLPSNMPKNSIVGEGGNLNDILTDYQMNM